MALYESPDFPFVYFNTLQPLNTGHSAFLYNEQISGSQQYTNNT